MKALSVFFLILFCCVSLFAQNAKIDSLKKVIATTKVDTVKGRSLCRLCHKILLKGNLESAFKNGREGLAILEKENDLHGIAHCLNKIGDVYQHIGNYPEALNYHLKSLETCQKIGDKEKIIKSLSEIYGLYISKGDFVKKIEYKNKIIKTYRQMNDNARIAECLEELALDYSIHGDDSIALKIYLKSLAIYQKLKNKQKEADCLLNLGATYFKLKNTTKGLECYEKSLKIYENSKNHLGTASCLKNIAYMYSEQNNYAEALDYYEKSLKIYQKHSIFTGMSTILMDIGNIYYIQNKRMEANEYFKKCIHVMNTEPNFYGNFIQWEYFSTNLVKKSEPLLAKTCAIKALQGAKEMRNLNFIEGCAKTLYQADSALGDWKSAFEHHKLYKQYSDSLHNEEKAKEFGRIESRYQFEKEAEEQKRKEEEAKRLAEIETERRNNLQYLSIFAGLMVLFGGLVFIGRFKIPVRVLDVALFASLLILFEFLLILFDPILDRYTGGIPIQKLVFNSVIALGFAPLHSFLEQKLRNRLTTKRTVTEG